MVRRLLLALTAAVPGTALALAAKPFVLGEWALGLGILLTFALPAVCMAALPRGTGPGGKDGEPVGESRA
jgi:hypothetical protein